MADHHRIKHTNIYGLIANLNYSYGRYQIPLTLRWPVKQDKVSSYQQAQKKQKRQPPKTNRHQSFPAFYFPVGKGFASQNQRQ